MAALVLRFELTAATLKKHGQVQPGLREALEPELPSLCARIVRRHRTQSCLSSPTSLKSGTVQSATSLPSLHSAILAVVNVHATSKSLFMMRCNRYRNFQAPLGTVGERHKFWYLFDTLFVPKATIPQRAPNHPAFPPNREYRDRSPPVHPSSPK